MSRSRISIINIIMLFIITQFAFGQESTLSFNIEPQTEQCLMEYFPDKTLVIYDISSNTTNLGIVIKTISKILLEETTGELKYPFTTYFEGYYEACMRNKHNRTARVTLSIKSGVAAKDYSSIARAKDLLPIDLELEKLTDRTKNINRYITFAQQHQKLFETSLDSMSSKIMIFSAILIGIMLLIGIIETLYLKMFMQRRKII